MPVNVQKSRNPMLNMAWSAYKKEQRAAKQAAPEPDAEVSKPAPKVSTSRARVQKPAKSKQVAKKAAPKKARK